MTLALAEVASSSGYPAPLVEGCSPTEGKQGERLDVTIHGENFKPGAGLGFGDGIVVKSVSHVSGEEVICGIRIFRKAVPGLVDVTVTNPDGKTGTLEGGFNVTERP